MNFRSSSTSIIEAAIGTMTAHSFPVSGTVRSSFWNVGKYNAAYCNPATMNVARTSEGFANGFIWKKDLSSERQFQALNHWNTASVVSATVVAFAGSIVM